MTNASPRADSRVFLGLVEAATLSGLLLVMTVATWSLALAQLGRHDGLAAVGLGIATAAIVGRVLVRHGGPVTLRLDRAELALGAGLVLAGAVMFLPGAPYALADKDPGVYVSHAFAIARDGDVTIKDPVLERMTDVTTWGESARFPGFWIDDTDTTAVTPQFFHLYPATMATAIDLVGAKGAWNMNPLLAILSILAIALAVRRAAGTLPATVAGGLLIASMLQVWQAKYPTTEILAQLLLGGVVLAVVLALDTGWAGAAALGGIGLGTGFLARPDGVLYIFLALAIAGGLYALRWWDRRASWLLGGLAVSLPYALWNAFGLREGYTLDNTVPRLPVLVAAAIALGLAAAATRSLLSGRTLAPSAALERRAGLVLVGIAGIVLLLAWFRADLLGKDYTYFGTQRIRSFDEQTLHWLSFFFGVHGLIAMWFGIGVVLLRRWRATTLMLVVPGLALLPLYLWEAKVSPRMMWWGRRFIPGIVPCMIVLIALFLGWALLHRRPVVRVAGAVLTLVLTVGWLQQSLPVRGHREMAGSYAFGREIAAVAGDSTGLFLFTWPTLGLNDPTRNFPGPVWFIHDQITSFLPKAPKMAEVEAYATAFPDAPIFVVSSVAPLPKGLDQSRFVLARHLEVVVPMWKESVTARPDKSIDVRLPLDVWQLKRRGA